MSAHRLQHKSYNRQTKKTARQLQQGVPDIAHEQISLTPLIPTIGVVRIPGHWVNLTTARPLVSFQGQGVTSGAPPGFLSRVNAVC
jgi:hypothetical protein